MSRIGLTIKSTELRPGEVMRTGERFVWSPSAGNGLYVNGDAMTCEIVLLSCEPWALHVALSPEGTIIAVDVPADAEALARVCRGEAPTPAELPASAPVDEILGCPYGASDSLLIAALRAHPDPLGLLARAKIAGPWRSGDFWLVRCDVATWRAVATEALGSCDEEDARLLADGWRLL